MSFDLQGKNAIVTGSTKGIGKAIANALAGAGANVVIVSRHQDDCDRVACELAEKYGVRSLAHAADLTRKAEIDSLVEAAVEEFGRIDILVNNAGSAVTKKAEDLTEDEFDRVLNLDLRAVFFCAQAVGKVMIGQENQGGVIINIASALGMIADKRVLPYCVAKGGVLQMTRALALEWARYNIRVNAICPGYVKTEINEKELSDEKIAQTLLRRFAIRRFAQAEEITGAVIFLASDESSYMTGQPIVIDGGWTCQ